LVQTPLAGVLSEMQTKAQAEVVLLDAAGRLLGSTMPGIKGELIDEHLRSYLALSSPGRAASRSLSVGSQEYEFQFTNFYLRQEAAGFVAVAVSRKSAMAEAILGVSLKALGLETALLLARNEANGLEVRATVGASGKAAGQLARLSPAKLAEGFASEATAGVEIAETLPTDIRRALRLFAELAGVERALVVPLIRGERNGGYLVAGLAAGYMLPQQDVELLQTIATEMALMIENADLRKKAELQSHRLDQAIIALEKISQALTA